MSLIVSMNTMFHHLTLVQFVLLLYHLEKCYVINSFYQVPRPRPLYRFQITISDIRHLKEFKKINENGRILSCLKYIFTSIKLSQ